MRKNNFIIEYQYQSLKMPPPQKKFVKYSFEDSTRNRDQRHPASRQNFKERENNLQSRNKKNVYTEKPSSKFNVLKDMINSFIPIKKPSSKIQQLMKNFPKFFSFIPKEPQQYNPQSLNSYLTMMSRKPIERQPKNFVPIEPQTESDPDWDSNSDVQGGIESKKIDQQLIEKTIEKLGNVKQLRNNQLKRHEKQFLEDYYRSKHQEELEKQKNTSQNQSQNQTLSSNLRQSPQKSEEQKKSPSSPDNQWTIYQQNQVENLVSMGFIQKIEENQEDFSEGEDNFSVEEKKSQSNKSESDSDGDNDIFVDEEPSKIISKKEVKSSNADLQNVNGGRVVINNNVFSRIAQAAGFPPGAVDWIIRNKTHRYKVTTQFMDLNYRSNNLCDYLPQVSLNHSEFVHNNDVQKPTSLQVFKKFNARRHQNHYHHGNHHQKTSNSNKNFDNKKKILYKPITNQNSKTHLNKK